MSKLPYSNKIRDMITTLSYMDYEALYKDGSIILYDKDPKYFAGYFGTVKVVGDEVEFNNKRYSSVRDLLNDMESFNSNLQYPIELYDPVIKEGVRTGRMIHFYLESIGFKFNDQKYAGEDQYLYKSSTSNTYVNLLILQSMDDTKGRLAIDIDDRTQLTFNYNNLDEAISSINGAILSTVLPDVTELITLINNLNDTAPNFDGKYKKFDFESLSVNSVNLKDYLIPRLESVLNNLKDSINGKVEDSEDR